MHIFCLTRGYALHTRLRVNQDALDTGDVSEVNWIRGWDNPADSLIKSWFGETKKTEVLRSALLSGELDIAVLASVTSDAFRRTPRPGMKFLPSPGLNS